ncbi:MAG: hypothetical protein LJE83_00735 [Gammaproteobacteria bacterium]|nr:hypothetical protein [Gammaproteobacteria bacterium]
MNASIRTIIPLFMFLISTSQAVFSETIQGETIEGETGASPETNSGWLNLAKMSDFERGGKLLVHVGGTADKVLIRLLSKGTNPEQPIGMEGGRHEVPDDRVVEAMLERDHKDIVQISVYGGPKPWGFFPLGEDNGPATILGVKYFKPEKKQDGRGN